MFVCSHRTVLVGVGDYGVVRLRWHLSQVYKTLFACKLDVVSSPLHAGQSDSDTRGTRLDWDCRETGEQLFEDS